MRKNKFRLWISFLLVAAVGFSAGVVTQLLRQPTSLVSFNLYHHIYYKILETRNIR
jgi:hypothetical protein